MELKNWKLWIAPDSNVSGRTIRSEEDLLGFEALGQVKIPVLLEEVLAKAKGIGDPYYSTNIWRFQEYEDRHQIYVSNFDSEAKDAFIVFEGIDTFAEIYLNGELIGETDNQFLPFRFPAPLKNGNNELLVHVRPNVVEGRKYDISSPFLNAQPNNYESLNLRKTASSFGWDILPRTALGGIFLPVRIEDSISEFEYIHFSTISISKEKAIVRVNIKLSGGSDREIIVEGQCDDSSFSFKETTNNLHLEKDIEIKDPKLWNVRGYGDPNLYEVSVETSGETKKSHFGIRTIELHRSSLVEEGGCFEFWVNGKKVFLLGTNYVPIEAIHHIDDERMTKAMNLILDIGCNAIRVWGGGTYESDAFYDLCDKNGIFIWQDFMMGCGAYPQDEVFQEKIEKEVRSIVKRLYNHPSICLWAGDNENDYAMGFWAKEKRNPNLNVLTRKLIPGILDEIDPRRPFLPSSPYIDERGYANNGCDLSEDHLWGPRDYFKGVFYRNANPYFASETGYHGMNSPASLKRFLEKPWPLFENEELHVGDTSTTYHKKPTKEHLAHGTNPKEDYDSSYCYRTELMFNQVVTLFGDGCNTLEKFALASQISQGEAMKYFIEKMRSNPERNGGIIWWNIIDGWPQISDAVVDYYFVKKAAYSFIRASQQPTLFMMDEKGEDLVFSVTSNEASAHKFRYEIIDGYEGNSIEKGEIESVPYSNVLIWKKPNDEEKRLYVIRYFDEKGNSYTNHFHANIKNIDLNRYEHAMRKHGLLKTEGF